jgi:hypothetical protein
VVEAVGVTDGEQQLTDRDQIPGQRPGRPPHADADDHGDDHAEGGRAVDDRPQPRRGQHEVRAAEQELGGHEEARCPREHVVPIGATVAELLPLSGVDHWRIRPHSTA